jgi:LytTr DNA-binding domain
MISPLECTMGCMGDTKNAQGRPPVDPVWDQSRPLRDETSLVGATGAPGGMTGTDWRFYGVVAAVSLTIAVVNAFSSAQDSAWRGGAYDFSTPLLWEITSIVAILALTPLLVSAVRRMRGAARWPLRVGIAIATIVVFSALHIAGMVMLRKLAVALAGGAYDFRFSVTTLLYEFRKDVVTCILIGGPLWLIESRRQNQPSQTAVTAAPASNPVSAPVVWLRDGATRIRIEPRDVLWISSAGNYVEYSLADGASHLIRGTLAAAEAELGRFHLARVHRTRLVNLGRVTSVEFKPSGDFELTFDTGKTVQGSRRYKTSVEALDRGAASA